ncbi:MAG: LCP family protein [Firmicutes bacterium]|nr:LCP family protein [Bacillota bacterium]
MSAKIRASARDRLIANLVLVAILGMVCMGAATLYLLGVFDPAEGLAMLEDTPPLSFATRPPRPESPAIDPGKAQAAPDDMSLPATEPPQRESSAPEEEQADTGDTPAMTFITHPPRQEGLVSWLFASASAEGSDPEQNTPPGADLEALLEDILIAERTEDAIPKSEIIAVDEKDLFIRKNLPPDWINILLLGTDGRGSNMKNGNTDLIMIASVNEKTAEIKLVSLARDMYVQIPGGSKSSRINTAYAYGGGGKLGAKLALKTINMLFEMNIQYYVVVNFADVVAIVDAIGGVDISLADGEYPYINEYVAIGEEYEGFPKSSARRTLSAEQNGTRVHLDGLQALSYARIRQLDNDLQRGNRHRILINEVLGKVMANLSYASIVSLANTMVPHTDTNFPIPTEGMRIGVALMWAKDSISVQELSLPIAGSFQYISVPGRNGLDMDVLQYNQKTNTKALHEFIYGEYIPAEAAEK